MDSSRRNFNSAQALIACWLVFEIADLDLISFFITDFNKIRIFSDIIYEVTMSPLGAVNATLAGEPEMPKVGQSIRLV